jgi:nucleotide-binding universal stress UspA family protein
MIRTILVAVDGSDRAAGVMQAAAEIARRFDAQIIPLRVIFVPAEFPPAAHVNEADPLPAHMKLDAERELRELMAQEPGARFAAPEVHHGGQPWRTILRLSEDLNADLVVIGSHGYHGMDRILGTTAGKVANLARRNVLVVHARAEAPSSKTFLAGGPESAP